MSPRSKPLHSRPARVGGGSNFPPNRRRRVEQKSRLYLDQGVGQVWVVNPRQQTIFVYDAAHPGGVQSVERIAFPPLIGEIAVAAIFRLA